MKRRSKVGTTAPLYMVDASPVLVLGPDLGVALDDYDRVAAAEPIEFRNDPFEIVVLDRASRIDSHHDARRNGKPRSITPCTTLRTRTTLTRRSQ
jgi:hypothetical protein